MSVPCIANKMEQADPTWCWINRHFGPQNAQWLRFSNNGSFLLNTSLEINCLWMSLMVWRGFRLPWNMIVHVGEWETMTIKIKRYSSWSLSLIWDQQEATQSLGRLTPVQKWQNHSKASHRAPRPWQGPYQPRSLNHPNYIYIYTDMNIVHDMTKANKCYEKQCTIQIVDWWNQATKLWSHMKSVWALQAIKSQLRRWWPCKIYWAMVPRQSFHEQFSEIHVVSRDTVETMTTSIMEEMQIMQSLHLSKNAGALPFTKSLPS